MLTPSGRFDAPICVDHLSRRAQELIQRSVWYSLALLLVCTGLPPVLGLSDLSFLPVLGGILALATLCSLAEPVEHRRTFWSLFCLALLGRLAVLVAVHWAALGAGGPFLGPDSTSYLEGSQDLAARAYRLPLHPALYLGSYDSAHYYLFAFAIRTFGVDLFALQLLNCGFTALVGPLMFSTSRVIVPRFAVLVGLIVALHPSLIVLSVLDLLKDPSVLFATVLTVWGLTRLVSVDGVRGTAGSVLAIFFGMTYLRMDRFYLAIFIELAVLGAAVAVLLRGRWGSIQLRSVAAGAVALLAAELAPAMLGWPPTPVMINSQLDHVGKAEGLFGYSPGLAARG